MANKFNFCAVLVLGNIRDFKETMRNMVCGIGEEINTEEFQVVATQSVDFIFPNSGWSSEDSDAEIKRIRNFCVHRRYISVYLLFCINYMSDDMRRYVKYVGTYLNTERF